jgi:hypothetical protein
MEEADYRAIVQSLGRTVSAADLDQDGRKRLIQTLARIKAMAAGKAHVRRRLIEDCIQYGGLQLTQIEYVRVLWDRLNGAGVLRDASERALNSFVRRQTGIDRVEWLLDPRECNRVIEALKQMLARAAKEKGGERDGT